MKTIAFIDSENATRELYAHLLEAAGYRVLQATTASYGMWLCREAGPDLIITTRAPVDAELEEGDYGEALRRMAGSTPVIVLSHGDNAGEEASLTPHRYVELMEAVRTELASRASGQTGADAASSSPL
jgi:DNA-binding response OmpR family regulator